MDMSIGLRSMAASCCGQLATHFGSKVSFPGNATYLATEASYWSLQEASLEPACIVTPTSPQDVSEAISIIVNTGDCHFAIKGQTHAPAAGFANIDGGVTIDMTRLDSVAVNEDKTVVSVGAGANWLDVYVYLDPMSLAVAGGRNGAVGVGGLTLGGGISYFSPRVGWVCDNVVNFQIVLASGALTNVNLNSHPDLFRALKGGMNNFGVVTRMDYASFSQGKILAGGISNPIDDRDAVFKAFADIAGAPNYDPYASVVTGLVFNATAKAWTISSAPIYTKAVRNPPVYEKLFAIPTLTNTLAIQNYSTFANESATPPLNWLFITSTYGVSYPLLTALFDIMNSSLYDFNIPNGGILWDFALEPLPTVFTSQSFKNGGDVLGVSPSTRNSMILLMTGIWPDPTMQSNAAVHAMAVKVMAKLDQKAEEMGEGRRFRYANYADPSQDVVDSYGEGNVEFLREVSRRYDPRGVFQKKVPGGFKLF